MSKLDELIAELCPDGVEYIPLGEVLKNNNAPNSIPKKYYKDNGDIPIIDQSQVYIAGYTDDESAVPPILPCIIFGDHTRVVKYADRKFAQGDSGTKVFIPVTEDLNTKYIYYAFCNIDIPSRGYNRHWTIAKNIKIPIPPLPVQQEIVRILDTFTELNIELNAELEARKKQYEYYRDLLLTFDDEVELIAELCPDGVPYKRLGELGYFYGGLSGKSKEDFTNGNAKFITYMNVFTNLAIDTDISDLVRIGENEKQNTVQYGDILFTGSSETLDECGMSSVLTEVSDEKFYLNSFCFGFRLKDNNLLLPDFSKYLFRSQNIRKQIKRTANGVTRFNVSKKKMEQVVIPLPPLPVQQEIVRILDNFTELIAELTAELTARQKQYEYYRDKLLSFKEVSS
ncbi:MAG: type restriction enzyme subunit [Thermosediminibacterales bacterium]|nr:type restriction enzyme subunit [Thermosediminibacterales bacterium]